MDASFLQAGYLLLNLIEFESMFFSPNGNCNLSGVFSGVSWTNIPSFSLLNAGQ